MKSHATLTSVLFLSVLIVLGVLFFCFPDQIFSEQENRALQCFPRLSPVSFFSGDFHERINDYYADQFPFRNAFVGWKGLTEIALGKGENNGILLGKNGQLARRLFDLRLSDGTVLAQVDRCDPAQVTAAAQGMSRVSSTLPVPVTFLLTGRTLDVAQDAFSYPTAPSDAFCRALRDAIPKEVSAPDIISRLRERWLAGEDVMFHTDHHWTARGAYEGYREVMRAFGMEEKCLPESAFTKQIISDSFYGTFWSAGGMKFVLPDTVELWLRGNEADFTVTADGKTLSGFYQFSVLEGKDHYAVFLDGTHDVVTVAKPGEERETLVIFKDSFANALAPFLAQHFDLVLLNLSSTRTDFTDLSAYSEAYHADRVLVVYTLSNLLTANVLARIR